jgi:hypothetical protein
MTITRKASSVAAALALVLFVVSPSFCDPSAAFASTAQSQTDLYVKVITTPFSGEDDKKIETGEDGNFELTPDVDYTGDSDLKYIWEASNDDGETWTRIDNDAPTLKQTNMPPGNYLYRVTIIDANNNSFTQIFRVTVPDSSAPASSSVITATSYTDSTQATNNTNDVSVQTGDNTFGICLALSCMGAAAIALLILAAYKRHALKSVNVKNSEV